MFVRLIVLLMAVVACSAFAPTGRISTRSMQMSASKDLAKAVGAVGMGLTIFAGQAFAVEGAAPKQGFFGVLDNAASSPFANNEVREDPLYSPYSPYGNGEAAVYKSGKAEEVKFWTNQLNKCMYVIFNFYVRFDPSYDSVTTHLTSSPLLP